MKKLQLLVASLAALLMLIPAAVSAVGYEGVGGQPAHPVSNNPRTKSIFIYQLKPGQQATDGIRIENNTKTRQTVSVYAVDSELSSGGSFSCAQAADAKTDVGAWVKLQTNSVQVAANSSQIVPFTVTVPTNAEVGEHDGCIAIQAASATKPSGRSGVLLSFRSAIRMVVTVPGKIVKKLTLTDVGVSKLKNGNYSVSPVAQNEGNVSLDTNVRVKLTSILGMSSGSQGGTYPVLPRSKATWNFKISHPFWGGWYRAAAMATYNSNPTAELGINQGSSKTSQLSSGVFFVLPSALGGLIEGLVIVVLAVLLTLYIKSQQDVRHIRRHWQDYSTKEGDTLADLAKSNHTSWRKLARVNKLKPPYELHKGQKLKVPPKRKV
jgi:hypothetical protein